MTPMRNERGIALVITLLVVALLTITVIEFTYSVEVDQHMARHALSGLQASLLARSGINLGEALLLHDDDPQVDAYTEDWCPQEDQVHDAEHPACNVDAANSQLVVPENMRLRVQIVDESGKFNINMTRPLNVNTWKTAKATANNPNAMQPFQAWQAALKDLLASRGVSEDVADALADYWDRLYQAQYGQQPGTNQTPQTGAAQPSPTPGNPQQASQTPAAVPIADFPSLDDASVIPGLTPSAIRRLRPVLTAEDSRRVTQVNINTASREVLSAIVGEAEVVDSIISQRQDTPLQQKDLGTLLQGVNKQDPQRKWVTAMLGVRSAYFQIRASAVVNPNPVTGRGGITRSAAMIVRRDPKPGVAPNAAPGTPRWTLTQLDWQKEGGAALFQQRAEPESGMEDVSASDF